LRIINYVRQTFDHVYFKSFYHTIWIDVTWKIDGEKRSIRPNFCRTVRPNDSVRFGTFQKRVRFGRTLTLKFGQAELNRTFDLLSKSVQIVIFFSPNYLLFIRKYFFLKFMHMHMNFWALNKLEKSESIKRGISSKNFVQISYCKSSVRIKVNCVSLWIRHLWVHWCLLYLCAQITLT